jgi:hypothetical protein
LEVISDYEGALGAAVDRAIEADPAVADKIRAGKVAAAGALIGAVMKEMRRRRTRRACESSCSSGSAERKAPQLVAAVVAATERLLAQPGRRIAGRGHDRG